VAADLTKAFAQQDVDDMVSMSRDLINHASPTGEEGAIGDYVAERFSQLGLRVQMQEVEPGRRNVIARLSGSRPGPTLLFLAHFDTSTDPGADLPMGFQPYAKVENGWIHGLGISNMKCAFAGFHSAIQMLKAADLDFAGEIVVAGVVGEIEKGPIDDWQGPRYRGGGLGARFMVNHGVTGDFCINGEPTGLRLQVANAGYAFVRIRVAGITQATFSRERSLDPIPKAIRLFEAIKEWEPEYQQRHPHPFMKLLVSVGGIYGGMPYKPSMTPSYCSLYLHVNTLPDQEIPGVKRELEELVAREAERDPELKATVEIFVASKGNEISIEHPVAQAVARAHRTVFGSEVTTPNPERFSVSSDNSPLAEFDIPGITYGAGGINMSGQYSMYEPGVGEVVSVENLAACSRVYLAAATDLLQERPADG
jgi:acetylornithine deacetylase/succinyl-diaminopimelate desuccinylase-like protein